LRLVRELREQDRLAALRGARMMDHATVRDEARPERLATSVTTNGP
jgi:hypothetical protein